MIAPIYLHNNFNGNFLDDSFLDIAGAVVVYIYANLIFLCECYFGAPALWIVYSFLVDIIHLG